MRKYVVNQPKVGENESSRTADFNSDPALTRRAAKDSDDMADSESTKSPAFRFYPADFVHGTFLLTTEEVGAYILLLCHCWDRGHIPSDIHLQARIAKLSPAKMRRAWMSLASKFKEADGGYIQPRLEKERQKQAEFRSRQKDAASKRWQSRGNATASAVADVRDMPDASHGNASVSAFSFQSSVFKEREYTPTVNPEISKRAGEFNAWYQEKHQELIGGYIGNPRKDDTACLRLCEGFSDSELRDAALVWFGMDDDFAKQGNRTIPKFASRVTECLAIVAKTVKTRPA